MLVLNPVLEYGADPYVSIVDDSWCLIQADSIKGRIYLKISNSSLLDVFSQKQELVFDISSIDQEILIVNKDIWAPEIYKIDNKYYIYISLCIDNISNRKIAVLASDKINGTYKFLDIINTNNWSIDGSIAYINDIMYFLWSGKIEKENHQAIFIAKMLDPVSIDNIHGCISTPQYLWEKQGSDQVFSNLFFDINKDKEDIESKNYINEGPQHLYKDNKHYIAYSASGSWCDDYCVGLLEYLGGDPLKSNSWKKHNKPIIKRNLEIIGPGHCSFTRDEKDRDWVVYHSTKIPGGKWNRQINMQRFYLKEDGSLLFPTPTISIDY
jgi:GH43 family beta-xylosidase